MKTNKPKNLIDYLFEYYEECNKVVVVIKEKYRYIIQPLLIKEIIEDMEACEVETVTFVTDFDYVDDHNVTIKSINGDEHFGDEFEDFSIDFCDNPEACHLAFGSDKIITLNSNGDFTTY